MAIKKNDNVIVITGKDKGKKGKITQVLAARSSVVVEGVNIRKRREKARRQGEKGQMVMVALPVHVSNVALFCTGCGKGVRTGAKVTADKKIRVCKKCGKDI